MQHFVLVLPNQIKRNKLVGPWKTILLGIFFQKTYHARLQSLNISNSITCSGTPQAVEALGLPFSVFSPSDVGI
jgi:hypothetical protein